MTPRVGIGVQSKHLEKALLGAGLGWSIGCLEDTQVHAGIWFVTD